MCIRDRIETEQIKTEQEVIQEKIDSLVAKNKLYCILAIIFIWPYFFDSSGDGQMLLLPFFLLLFSVINYFEIQKYREELEAKAID